MKTLKLLIKSLRAPRIVMVDNKPLSPEKNAQVKALLEQMASQPWDVHHDYDARVEGLHTKCRGLSFAVVFVAGILAALLILIFLILPNL